MSEGTEGDKNPQAESTLDKMARGMTEETGAWGDIPQEAYLRGTYRRANREVHRRETHSHSSRAK